MLSPFGAPKFCFSIIRAMADSATTQSPIDQLADIWTAKANALPDDETRLECLALIADWRTARAAVSALSSSSDVQSYSIAGRTVTRNDLRVIRREVESLADQIRAMLNDGGGALVADLRRAFIP